MQDQTDEVNRPAPWVPRQARIRSPRRTAQSRPDAGHARSRAAWDVVWTFDGQRFSRRFARASDADAFAADLHRGVATGLPFDPVARRFVEPDRRPPPLSDPAPPATAPDLPASSKGPTVAEWTQRYWDWKWPSLEPKGRGELSRYLNRVRRHFLSVEPGSDEAAAIDAYLRRCSLAVQPVEPTPEERAGADVLRWHSLPLPSIGRREIEDFVARYSFNQRYPDRPVAALTVRRMVADLKQCWTRAVVEEVLDTNPWDRMELDARRRGGGGRSAGAGVLPADAGLVLGPDQIVELADECTRQGGWGEVARCFVLVMGFCGLRPNEATGLVVGDVELTDGGGWLTVRRSRRRVPDRFLDHEEDRDWGPLKGLELTASRRVPVPTRIVGALKDHLARFCTPSTTSDLVFHRDGKPFDLSVFGSDVWAPARRALFPPRADLDPDSPLQPKLSRLRRHDLRHSACSMWLRARVDVSVCQRWSGHKRLSVFLDVYQGLIPGREEEGVRLVNDMLGDVPVPVDAERGRA